MQRIALHSRRSRTSCSIIALATVMTVGATPALSKSFNATGNYATNVNATGIVHGATTTTINLNAGQTVIDWTPDDNALGTSNILFQGQNTTATFQSSSDFSVLNRITPASMSRAIEMNGTINARVGGVQKGNVYFYSPNGFVFGGTSVLSVGSLVVTTSPLQLTGNNFINGADNTVVFQQTSNPNAQIVSNGTIDANFINFGVPVPGGSYVALVAPRVVHTGTITVKGSAALVAAEAATINFSTDGLFDISVSVGTTSSDGINVTGDIGGNTQPTATDQRRVYAVAVPKNDALTMAFGSGADLGFTLAGNASIDQYGAVVLSAGHDISNGQIGAQAAGHGANANGNININGSHFTNNVTVEATGSSVVTATGGAQTRFDSNLDVHADEQAWMSAFGAGSLVDVNGNVSMSTDAIASDDGSSATGGYTSVFTNLSGAITIDGNLSLTADGWGGDADASGEVGGTGTGGHAQIQNFNGSITIGTANSGGDVFLSAVGRGGEGLNSNGGLGKGGFAEATSENGTLTIHGLVTADASGTGGRTFGLFTSGKGEGGRVLLRAQANGIFNITDGIFADARGIGGETPFRVSGGAGKGGEIQLQAQGANAKFNSTGNVSLLADGIAGFAIECTVCGGLGGTGTGGDIDVGADGTGAAIALGGELTASADGEGGEGVDSNGGFGKGGSVQLSAGNGGVLGIVGEVEATADGDGGDYIDSELGYGADLAHAGNGEGGFVELFTWGTGTPDINLSSIDMRADGHGGDNHVEGIDAFAGSGTGGTAWLDAQKGTIDITGSANVSASGHGGDADFGLGGDGTGKDAEIDGIGGAVTIAGTATVEAMGIGGDGLSGGDGTGGGQVFLNGNRVPGASIFANNGSVTVGSAVVSADGFGGSASDGAGGNGTGGVGQIVSTGLGVIGINGNATISAAGEGGDSEGGTGGNGTGKLAALSAINGDVSIAGVTILDADGTGGDGINGGDGRGGGQFTVNFEGAHIFAQNGDIVLDHTVVSASGNGGWGAEGGTGGDGFGGYATIVAGNSNLGPSLISVLGDIETSANVLTDGVGGRGGDGLPGNTGTSGGAGGDGTGGFSGIVAGAGNGHIDIGFANLSSQGFGGDGGDGGNGDNGAGGNGGAGGNAVGGHINVGTESGAAQATASNLGLGEYGSILADASATGGQGGDGNFGATNGNGGSGGDAEGGTAVLLVRGSKVDAGFVELIANATGGDGGLAGGLGAVAGAGGDAESDEVGIVATSRDGFSGQHGTLLVDNFVGTVTSTGGAGSTTGASLMEGGSGLFFDSADATIGNLSLQITAAGLIEDLAQDAIQIVNGDVAVTNTLSFHTDGHLSFYIDNGSLNVSTGTLDLSASNFIDNPDFGAPANRGTAFANQMFVSSGGDFIADADFDVTNTLSVSVPGSIQVGNVHDDNSIFFWAGGSIDVDDLDAGGSIGLFAGGSINALQIDAGGYVDMDASGGSIQFSNIDAGSFVDLFADSTIDGTDIDAGGSIFARTFSGDVDLDDLASAFGSVTVISGSDIFLSGDVLADGDIELTADGNIVMQNATAGESIDLDSSGYLDEGGGYIDGLNLTAGDSVEAHAASFVDLGNISAGLINPSTNEGADYTAAILAGGNIITGNIAAASHIGLATPGTMSTGTIDAGGIFMALGHGNMTFLDTAAGDEVYLADFSMMALGGGDITGEFDGLPVLAATPVRTGGSITIGNVDTGKFTAAAGTSLTTGIIETGAGIGLDAGGAITTNNLFAGDFVLANGGSITTGDIEANSVDMTSTGGNITTGDIFAIGAVEMDAFGDIFTDDITAGSIDLYAGDDIRTLDLTTQFLVLLGEGGGIGTLLFPGASITLEAEGDISTGNIDSIDGVFALAGGALSTGTIDAVDFVDLDGQLSVTTLAINAGQYIYAESDGNVTLGNLTAGLDVNIENGGNTIFGNAVVGTEFDFESGGNVTGGNITAGATIDGEAGGSVTLLNLVAGFEPGEYVDDDTFSIGIQAAGPISVGNVEGADRVGFATLGSLTTGTIDSGWDFFAFADGNIVTGAITTGEGDHVFMSGTDAFLANGGGEDSDFLPEDALADGPSATDGSITINGPVSTGTFRAWAGTGLTTQAITADLIQARAGGMATINGLWSAPDASLVSNDITIGQSGGIAAGANGEVNLLSSNSSPMLIGDGLTGTGYALSNAEFSRISGGEINIIAGAFPNAAANTLIGDLTVTAGANGNIRNANGGLAILGLSESGESPDGTMRVVGDVIGTGFANTNYLAFGTEHFQLDAANGLISLSGPGGGLGGELDIFADTIHVAALPLLLQLAANSTYTGYQQDLNEAATVQRPDGVIRADTLWIESENLSEILIQNTGTDGPGGTPAGFLVRQAFVNEDFESAGAPGSINLIVNGQVVGEGGTLTGVAARDALITEETDISPFTSNSTINGCPLTGECIILPPPPPPTGNVVDSQIDLIFSDPLGDSDFGNEPDIDDNEEGDDGANSPISPPQPLFDTRPLIPSSDVNDPVSGTGNPALLGSDAQCDEDEDGQCPANPVEGDKQ